MTRVITIGDLRRCPHGPREVCTCPPIEGTGPELEDYQPPTILFPNKEMADEYLKLVGANTDSE